MKFLVRADLEAGFGEKGTGAGGVVGVLGDVGIVPFFISGGFGSPEGLAATEEDSADETLAVDAVGDGLAKPAVGKPGEFIGSDERFSCGVVAWVLVEPDKTGIGRGATIENGETVAGGVAIDPGDIIWGEALGIGLASGEGESAGVGVFDQFSDEKVDVGKANALGVGAPVVWVSFEDDAFGGLIGAEAKGAGGEEALGFFLGDANVPGFKKSSVAEGGLEFVFGEEADPADRFEKGSVDLRGG